MPGHERFLGVLDLSTRVWWRIVGRRVDPSGGSRWLRSHHNERGEVGDDWLHTLERHGLVRPHSDEHGLLERMDLLDGPDFDAAGVHPLVRDFYEHTASWRMEVWSQWNPVFAPGGALVTRLFGRRIQQLALPISPMSVSRGMTSAVHVVDGPDGRRDGAAWLRTLRSDHSPVYSGFYQVASPGDARQPHVKVTFPLEEGSVQVFLTPRLGDDGSLWLHSRSRTYGSDGAYIIARVRRRWYAAMLPLHETFHVFVDEEGVLRTDHQLRAFGRLALRLHYRLDRTGV